MAAVRINSLEAPSVVHSKKGVLGILHVKDKPQCIVREPCALVGRHTEVLPHGIGSDQSVSRGDERIKRETYRTSLLNSSARRLRACLASPSLFSLPIGTKIVEERDKIVEERDKQTRKRGVGGGNDGAS